MGLTKTLDPKRNFYFQTEIIISTSEGSVTSIVLTEFMTNPAKFERGFVEKDIRKLCAVTKQSLNIIIQVT